MILRLRIVRWVQAVAWVPEYSGNDSTWKVFRSTYVKARPGPCPTY